jgi:hypothetical protein
MVLVGKAMKKDGRVEFENRKTKEKLFVPYDQIVAHLEQLALDHARKIGAPLPIGAM